MKNFLLITLIFCLGGCLNATIYSDYGRGNDFKIYKTFAWSPEPHRKHKNGNFDTEIIEKNVKVCVNNEMQKRGYSIDVNNPDLILDFDIMVEKKVETITTPVYRNQYNYNGYYSNTRYNNFNGYNGGMQYQVGTKVQHIPYKQGTLTIDIIDREKNQLIWKGWSESTLYDPQTYSRELPKDIRAIFKRYPVAIFKNK